VIPLSRGRHRDSVASLRFEFLGGTALIHRYFQKTVASD
jgi:hypothetical protein